MSRTWLSSTRTSLPSTTNGQDRAFSGATNRAVHIFRHELMQCFSMHLFAKFPVEPITTLAQYRAAIT